MEFGAEFWVAISFVIFILLVSKPVAAVAAKFLDARSAKIKAEIDTATELAEEAEALLLSIKDKCKNLEQEIEEILASARKQAESLVVDGRKNLSMELEKREKLLTLTIADMERNFITSVYRDIINLAISVSYNFFQTDLPEDANKEIFNKSLVSLAKIKI